MTLTELKYIVAVARHKHFGHAAAACFVAQPTLSVGVKKLEDELGVTIFERGGAEITVTQLGAQIVAQAERVLEQSGRIREIAQQSRDPLVGPLRLGVIYTIGPYLLPELVRQMIDSHPTLPLMLQENYTLRLLEMLRQGELDAAIVSDPLPEHGFLARALYDEPFVVALPAAHPLCAQAAISAQAIKQETLLLLGQGHCFRDQVLGFCPELGRMSGLEEGLAQTFEGSSPETIRHMVASGIGLTVLPLSAVSSIPVLDERLAYRPFADPAPSRRVVMVWRKSFSRLPAIDALCAAVRRCALSGVHYLEQHP